jgi:SAM-dependent methyltransferase
MLREVLKKYTPRSYQNLSQSRQVIRLVSEAIKNDRGTYNVECPICGFIGHFRSVGSAPRWNAKCPSCGSLERHRQLALVLRDLPLSGSLLHFAPEQSVAKLLKAQGVQYTSADLYARDVDLKLNIEKIDLHDDQYDVVVCSHVLEHVNDRAALSELRRILKPDGLLIAMVPIVEGCETTYEDETIVNPKDREIHFGQDDHVRVYGADFVRRLTDAEFVDFKCHTAFGKEAIKYGLLMGEKIFLCRKKLFGFRGVRPVLSCSRLAAR